MDLYGILGIEKNCDADAIRKAYRRKVADAHPDRGGDVESFRQIQTAYEVLIDPKRREYYDRTGGIDEQADLHRISQIVSEIMGEFLFDGVDIFDATRQQLEKQRADLQKTIAGVKKKLDELNRLETKIADQNRDSPNQAGLKWTLGYMRALRNDLARHLLSATEEESFFGRCLDLVHKLKLKPERQFDPGGGPNSMLLEQWTNFGTKYRT